MNVYIQLLIAGVDTGPFDLKSDVDGFSVAFETGVPKASLVAGYTSTAVPEGSTQIKVESTGKCTNSIIIDISISTTTTTTTAVAITTTTTTTEEPTTSTTTTCYDSPLYYQLMECYTDDTVYMEMHCLTYQVNDFIRFRHNPDDGHEYCGQVTAIDQPANVPVVTRTLVPVTGCADGCYEPPP